MFQLLTDSLSYSCYFYSHLSVSPGQGVDIGETSASIRPSRSSRKRKKVASYITTLLFIDFYKLHFVEDNLLNVAKVIGILAKPSVMVILPPF